MTVSVLVTNEGPVSEPESNVPPELLQIFRGMDGLSSACPFTHQAKVFRRIGEADQEVLLIAGTAAGKTLALAVPLFWKLREKRIRRVLFMYPTLALLEDQRKVIDQLAKITGLQVGDIKGGMTRSQLITSLNRHVILATPDAVYWFFRKNVKYNALLIYGLCQVDEFVIDEAHLFNGLMLRNFQHLWQRIKTLAGILGKRPRLHILTATPTEELRRLSTAEEVSGESKGRDVNVEFRASGRYDRDKQFVTIVKEMLEAGQRRLLVVCNSARMAHQLFEKYSIDEKETSRIPVEHLLRFGRVKLGDLTGWLEHSGVEKELIEGINQQLLREEEVVLADVPDGTALSLALEEVILHTNEILQRQCWQVKRALWQRKQSPGETWESLLGNRPLPCHIIAAVRNRLDQEADVERQQAIVDEWLADTVEKLGNMADDPIPCHAPEFAELKGAFSLAGISSNLASLLTKKLTFEMSADPNQLPTRHLSTRPLYLRWLEWLVKEAADRIREIVKAGLGSGDLSVECRHIGLWKNSDVPVIVYSGSMAKQAREGLINVFADPNLKRAVLISTSAVEVGVDFHADALITEECEGNSFLQRFGRVGRHEPGCKVIALVSGDTHAKLAELDGTEMRREDFSTKITDAFPRRNYAAGSQLLDASHYLINEQLGRIGERLNAAADTQVRAMADRLRVADLQLGFGLRSTMPQITLRDGVTKDPFYLLRYVDDQDLRPADSPFEVARAKTWFTSLIFRRAMFDVIVDLEETLKASEHLSIWHAGRLNVVSRRGIGLQHLNGLVQQKVEWSERQALYFILLHGDVYLSRIDRSLEMATTKPVKDAEGDPLFIPKQTYLVLWKWTDVEKARRLFEGAGVAGWEELHYDWERLKENRDEHAMVILEKTTGACFAAYKELMDYVNR